MAAARAALVFVYGVCLAAWFYLEQKQLDIYSQGVYDFLHSAAFTVGFVVLLPLLVGWLVGRLWALAVLAGPFASLSYLQLTGYVSPWHDGSPPLGMSTLAVLLRSGALLLLGVALHAGFTWRRPKRERAADAEDDWTWGK